MVGWEAGKVEIIAKSAYLELKLKQVLRLAIKPSLMTRDSNILMIKILMIVTRVMKMLSVTMMNR